MEASLPVLVRDIVMLGMPHHQELSYIPMVVEILGGELLPFDVITQNQSFFYFSGGSHGGFGGGYNTTGGTILYGNISRPVTLGSPGTGSCGGGAIEITASNSITIDGTISSDGGVASDGSGSGGSVNIVAGIIKGAGTIYAQGGSATVLGASSGGGGRIAISATQFNFSGVVTAAGGYHSVDTTDPNDQYRQGSAGTILLARGDNTTLIIDNNGAPAYYDTPWPFSSNDVSSLTLRIEDQVFTVAIGTSLTLQSLVSFRGFGLLKVSGLATINGPVRSCAIMVTESGTLAFSTQAVFDNSVFQTSRPLTPSIDMYLF